MQQLVHMMQSSLCEHVWGDRILGGYDPTFCNCFAPYPVTGSHFACRPVALQQ